MLGAGAFSHVGNEVGIGEPASTNLDTCTAVGCPRLMLRVGAAPNHVVPDIALRLLSRMCCLLHCYLFMMGSIVHSVVYCFLFSVCCVVYCSYFSMGSIVCCLLFPMLSVVLLHVIWVLVWHVVPSNENAPSMIGHARGSKQLGVVF